MSHQPAELPEIAAEGSRSVPASPRDEKAPSYDEKHAKFDGERGAHDSDHGHYGFDPTEKLDPYVV
jgi:hypothetical protein